MRCTAFLVAALTFGIADASAQNLVDNGEFDFHLGGWDNLGSRKNWSAFDDSDDPSSGSIEIINDQGPGFGVIVTQCIPIQRNRTYDVAYSHYSFGAEGTTGRAELQIEWSNQSDCETSLGSFGIESSVAEAWTDVAERVTAPAIADGVTIVLNSHKQDGNEGAQWIVYFDHVSLPEPGVTAPLAAVAALGVAARLRRAS